MCYDPGVLRRGMIAVLAFCACSSKARVELHISHGSTLSVDSLHVHAELASGAKMGDVDVTDLSSFFNNCTSNIVNVVVGDRAPARVHVVVTAMSGSTPVVDDTMIDVDSGETKTYYSRLRVESRMVPDCEGGVGGSSGMGGAGGTGGMSGTGGTSGTGGSGGGDLGAPCTSGAQCSAAFPTCLMSVLQTIPFPNGYCTKACPPGNDCGPNGTWGEWTINAMTECWCQPTCNSASDCHRSDGYACCRSSPIPDGGTPPAGACNPPATVDPQYCN